MLKNRLTYGLVILVLFLFIYLQEHRMTYLAFYAVLIMPILSYLIGLRSKYAFLIDQKLSHDFMTKEQQAIYTVSIRNRSFLPCSFARIRLETCRVGLDVTPVEKYFSLRPYESQTFDFKINGSYRGAYDIEIKDIICYDFLGLFRFKLPAHKLFTLTIMPRIISISDLSLKTDVEDVANARNYIKGEDYSNIAELRAFQPTDSYRQIHWKASAKKGELMSKNFHEEERHAATFLIDNRRIIQDLRTALEQEDKMMERVVSAMSYCYHLSYPISIRAIGERPVDFTTDFSRLYKKASKLTFTTGSGFNVLLNDYLNSGQVPMNLFIFVSQADPVLLMTLESLAVAGNQITMFLFKNVHDEMIDKLRMLEISMVFIDE